MWEVRVTQKYTSDHGIDLEETAAFRVPELTEAGEIINTFKKYGIGKMSYSITQKQVEQQKDSKQKKIVQIEDLSVSFDGMEVVKHVNIEVNSGEIVGIVGESGSGKTTSMRNLDPKTTYYIDADKKGLSWKGWRKQYNKENKNYLACDDANIVRQYIKRIAEACPGVKVIVVDTVNGLMVADEMRRSKEKGYDKWVDLAACVWDLVCEAYTYRDDLTIIFTAHTQTDHDEAGYMFTRIKTSGKKLDKICLESKFTTVLLSKCVDGAYKFETQANNSTAKSPMGAFDQMEIDNDIVEVMKALEDY